MLLLLMMMFTHQRGPDLLSCLGDVPDEVTEDLTLMCSPSASLRYIRSHELEHILGALCRVRFAVFEFPKITWITLLIENTFLKIYSLAYVDRVNIKAPASVILHRQKPSLVKQKSLF